MTGDLRVAIVHYHLRRGGVTRVIETAVSALPHHGIRTCILTGERPDSELPGVQDISVIEGLEYERQGGSIRTGLWQEVRDSASRLLGGGPDVWHFHNHALGKNASVPLLVDEMARAGMKLLLQLHDFAEDGRPENYRYLVKNVAEGDISQLGTRLYPASENVHYAVLNGRDRRFMIAAGLPDHSVHYLPNPVSVESPATDCRRESRQRLFVYPTRAIPRKNIGEFILWAASAERDARFAVTLSPKNPVFRPHYEKWVRLCDSLRLPVEFDYASTSGLSLAEIAAKSSGFATTSVAEGFGLAFLEPWAMNRPVFGRDLPEITGDMKEAGVHLEHLCNRLDIPVDWVEEDLLRARTEEGMRKAYDAFGREVTPAMVDSAMKSIVIDGMADFGRLDQDMQEGIIRRIADSAGGCRLPVPHPLSTLQQAERLIEKNRSTIESEFSPEKYAARLAGIYRDVAESASGTTDCIDAGALLDQFISPERFNLLRTI